MNCPVCAYPVTRHYDHQHAYWFCTHCWQEVPEFDTLLSSDNLTKMVRSRHVSNQLGQRRRAKSQILAKTSA